MFPKLSIIDPMLEASCRRQVQLCETCQKDQTNPDHVVRLGHFVSRI